MSDKPDYWRYWAAQASEVSPLYARLALAIGESEELRSLAARARSGQPHANMILGAVHFLLLRGRAHPLARFYATLGGSSSPTEEDPFPEFADFVKLHESEISSLIETRVTNTNEVGRSALLHPGLRAVAEKAGAPLNIIEIGPSAGLNLIWDRYGVRFLRGGVVVAESVTDGALLLDCELRGNAVPPLGNVPPVARRIGLELSPVDLNDEGDRDWLRALIWPDLPARLARLDQAIAQYRSTEDVIEIRPGDALDNLVPVLRGIPENEPVCVFHTIALYQFSREMRQTVEDLLTVAGLRRPVFRLSFEQEDRARTFGAQLSLIRYHDGMREAKLLADCQPHGAWIEWRA